MHHTPHEIQVIFGIEPMLFAGSLFVLTYILFGAERLHRAIVSLTAACLMIMCGVLTQEAVF